MASGSPSPSPEPAAPPKPAPPPDPELARDEEGVPVWSEGVYVDGVPHEILLTRDKDGRPKLCFSLWDSKMYSTGSRYSVAPWKWYDLRDVVAVHSGEPHKTVWPVPLSCYGAPKAQGLDDVLKRMAEAEASDGLFSYRMYMYLLRRWGGGRWGLKRLRIDFTEGQRAARWRDEVRRRLGVHCAFRPQRLLVFLNPFGGRRQARQIYRDSVAPLFRLMGIRALVVETQRANHARDELEQRAGLERDFDGVVSVGGDGLYNEVLVGLVRRAQGSDLTALNSIRAELVRPQLRVGIIPAGSTNGLCHTVHGCGDALTAALHIGLGDAAGVDVCGVYGGDDRFLRFASTMVSFGFLGDALRLSETMRWMGPTRYQVAGFHTFLRHPSYPGQVAFAPVFSDAIGSGIPSMTEAFKKGRMARCRANCSVCRASKEVKGRVNRQSSTDSALLSVRGTRAFPNHVTGQFSHLVGVVTPCISDMSPEGLSPAGHIGDGCMDLGVLSHISRRQNFVFMLRALLGGGHMGAGFVHTYRVSRFAFTLGGGEEAVPEPPSDAMRQTALVGKRWNLLRRRAKAAKTSPRDSPGQPRPRPTDPEEPKDPALQPAKDPAKDPALPSGVWNIDGELLGQGGDETFVFRCHRQLLTLFARGIEDHKDLSSVRRPRCWKLGSRPVSSVID